MKNNNILLIAIACLTIIGAINCTAPVEVTGGASGTDVGVCVVAGEVFDTLGQPVAGSLVRLRPFDYIVGQEGQTVIKRDGYSDFNGHYFLDSVPPGHYVVECISPDSLGQALECVIDSIDTFPLTAAVVQPMAVIVGDAMGQKPEEKGDRSVQVRGLERSASIDSSGNFSLMVPSGWRTLNLHGIDPDHPDIDTLLYLQPGRNEMDARSPHDDPPQCDSLVCELAAVREILDLNDLQPVMPESVVTAEGDHVVELRLRGMGIRTLPESIDKLIHLRVLDVGDNDLREFPRGIERLHRLVELVADSNALWTIPGSIGTLDSLRRLDLSFNQLQSVQETITYLDLTYLDLSGNMLCNIGEFTEQWISAHDPDWKVDQNCR